MKPSSVGEHYVPSSNIRSAADIERAAAGVIDVDAKTTTYVVLACIVAASGGVLFGYDGGVTGAVCLTFTVISTRPQRGELCRWGRDYGSIQVMVLSHWRRQKPVLQIQQ